MKVQQEEIARTLKEITLVQADSTEQIKVISKLDKEVEDILFKPAQKDKTSKKIYEEFLSLKDCFSKLIENVQNQNIVRNATKEVQMNIDVFKLKYKNLGDLETVQQDIANIQQENAKLEKYINHSI